VVGQLLYSHGRLQGHRSRQLIEDPDDGAGDTVDLEAVDRILAISATGHRRVCGRACGHISRYIYQQSICSARRYDRVDWQSCSALQQQQHIVGANRNQHADRDGDVVRLRRCTGWGWCGRWGGRRGGPRGGRRCGRRCGCRGRILRGRCRR
jgi:hypothetical protein